MHNAWGFLCGAGKNWGSCGISRGKKSVQIHILQRGAQARQQEEMEEKD